jgi:hypothetical protein
MELVLPTGNIVLGDQTRVILAARLTSDVIVLYRTKEFQFW